MTDEQIQLGSINAAYGIKGWVKVFSYTDPVEQIFLYSPWQLRRSGKTLELEVDQMKVQGRNLLTLFKGFEDRNQAESVIGYEIWIDRAQLPDLPDGEYYWNQLQGLTVINQAGLLLGRIDHMIETGANDVLVVRPNEQSVDDQERLIPYIEGEVVIDVDLDTKKIVVDWQTDY